MDRLEHTTLRDRGQAAVLVVIVAAALFAALTAATTTVGTRMIERTRAQSAADAAALASIRGGRDVAETLARRHGATLVSFTRGPASGQVTVVVRLGSATAVAAGTDAP